MSKNYEHLISNSKAMVYLTMLRLMLTRLAKENAKRHTRPDFSYSLLASRDLWW